MLVGQIVAHEDRTRGGEGGFRHEGLERVALGRAMGAKLGHHRAALQREVRSCGASAAMNASARLGLVRGQAIMERDPGRLSFDQQAVAPAVGERFDRLAHVVEPERNAERQARPVGQLQLEPVRAGKGDAVRAGGGASRSASERPLTMASRPSSLRFKPLEHRSERRRDRNPRRACRPARPEFRRNRGTERRHRAGRAAAGAGGP